MTSLDFVLMSMCNCTRSNNYTRIRDDLVTKCPRLQNFVANDLSSLSMAFGCQWWQVIKMVWCGENRTKTFSGRREHGLVFMKNQIEPN